MGSAEASRALPSWAEYHGTRAEALAWRALAEGRIEDAKDRAREATDLLPDAAGAWAVAARAAIGEGAWEEAMEAVQELRRRTPDSVDGLELLGRVSLELGRAPEARHAFEAQAALQPDSVAPLLGLALVSARLDNDTAAAIAQLRAAAARDPRLDLSGLLLRPEWSPLADDSSFVSALNALLAELRPR